MVYLQLSGWFWQLPLPDFLQPQFNRLNIHITAIESTFQSFKKAKNLLGKDFRTSILLVQVQTRSKSIFWMFTQPIEIFIHPCTTTLHCSLRFQRSKSLQHDQDPWSMQFRAQFGHSLDTLREHLLIQKSLRDHSEITQKTLTLLAKRTLSQDVL